jgi:hypothetical protein
MIVRGWMICWYSRTWSTIFQLGYRFEVPKRNVGLMLNHCFGLIRFSGYARFRLLKLLVWDCQVCPTCQRKVIAWMTPQEISFSLLNLLSVIHLKWTMDDGVFIPLSFIPKFFCGINKLAPEFSSDFFWSVASLLPLFPLSYDLSLIIDIYP